MMIEVFVLVGLSFLLAVCLLMFYQNLKILKRLEVRIEMLEKEILEIQTKLSNVERATALVCELQKLLVETKEKEFRPKNDVVRYLIPS